LTSPTQDVLQERVPMTCMGGVKRVEQEEDRRAFASIFGPYSRIAVVVEELGAQGGGNGCCWEAISWQHLTRGMGETFPKANCWKGRT